MVKESSATNRFKIDNTFSSATGVQLVAYTFFLAAAVSLCLLAYRFPRFPGDLEAAIWLQSLHFPLLEGTAMGIALAGRNLPSLAMILGTAAGLWLARKHLEAIFILLTIPPNLLNKLLKLLVGRPRPADDLVQVLDRVNELSFPSGHVVHYLLLFGFLFYLTSVLVKNMMARTTLLIFFALPIMAVGPSRVYVGAHWPSDVLGGYLVGSLFLAAMIWGYKKRAQPNKT